MIILKRLSKKPPIDCSYYSDEFQAWLKETKQEIDGWKLELKSIKEKAFYIKNGICWFEARNGD